MPHAADKRDRTCRNHANDGFIVERGKILDRPAAPHKQDHFSSSVPFKQRKSPDNSLRSIGSLHRCWRHQQAGQGISPLQHLTHILQRGAAGRGHHADHSRAVRQGLFAGWVEQTFVFELLLQAQEVQVSGALACRPELLSVKLVLAACLINADVAEDLQRLPLAADEFVHRPVIAT